MWYLACIFVAVALANRVENSSVNGKNLKTESDLRKALFQNYDKLVRPVKNIKSSVMVNVSLVPIAIKEVDEKNNVLVLDSWITMKWTDDYFKWNPKDYDNIKVLRLPSTEVWKPDLAIYTTTPDTGLFPKTQTQVLLFNSKEVMWVPMHTISTRCPMIDRDDKSTIVCNIRIGSWTYSGYELNPDLASSEVDLRDFQDIHPDWTLQKVASSRENKFYPCCEEPYPVLHFNFTLKKRRETMKLKDKSSDNYLIIGL